MQFCLLNGGEQLVVRGEQKEDKYLFRLLDGTSGVVKAEWEPFCHHYCELAPLDNKHYFAGMI